MLFVARTFSAFPTRANYDGGEYYPVNWAALPAFKKVHDWWAWACSTDIRLALRVDLLTFILHNAELMRAYIDDLPPPSPQFPSITYEGTLMWTDNARGLTGLKITHTHLYGFNHRYVIRNEANLQCREFTFKCITHEQRWTGNIYRKDLIEAKLQLQSDHGFSYDLTAPDFRFTKPRINDWAIDLLARLESDYPNFYNCLRLPPGIDSASDVVQSLHTGPKTICKTILESTSLDIMADIFPTRPTSLDILL